MTSAVHHGAFSSRNTGHLRRPAVRGGAVTLFAQAVKFALQLAATMLLARLLTPNDYGLIAMVTALLGFVALFKDLGLSMATVQQPVVSHEQVSTLFWINVALSLLLMVLSSALAPAIAWFYGEPRLVEITICIAACFIFGGLTAQHQALLHRQMRYTALAVIEISSLFVSILAALGMAVAGAGYWSLVGQTAALAASRMVLSWAFSKWLPGLPSRLADVRSMLLFGGNLTGFTLLNFATRNFDNVLVGRYLGGSHLGLYSKAYNLLLLPMQQINSPVSRVITPVLSRLHDQPLRFRKYYLTGIQLIAACGMPVVVLSFVTADALLPALLGPQWTGVVPIYRVLAAAAFVDTINVATGWVFVSLGQTRRMFRWQVLESAVTAGALVAGLPWGVLGVAAGFAISRVAMRYPALAYCYRGTPIRFADAATVLWCPASAAILAGVALWLLRYTWAETIWYSHLMDLALSVVVFALVYISAWFSLPTGRQQLNILYELLRELYRSRSEIPIQREAFET